MIQRHPAIRFADISLAELINLSRHATQQGGGLHNVHSKDGRTYCGYLVAPRAALMAANEVRVSNAA